MITKIRAFILVVKNAIEFYKYLQGAITKARYYRSFYACKREFDVIRDDNKTKQEKLEALHELEKELNSNCR